MKTKTFRACLVLMTVFTCGLFGQDRASLGGRVLDPSGAVVPGVRLELRHPETGFVRQALTDELGMYRFSGLSIGAYEIDVEMPGFAPRKFKNIQLTVGQRAVLDVTLGVEAIQSEVQVFEQTIQLDRSTAEIGGLVSGTDLTGIPLNGRNWSSFMILAPGAVNIGDGSQNSIRYFGRARDDNNFTFDGVDATGVKDPRQEANLRLNISLDSIQEFRVSSSLYTAESGSGPGAQMNLVSKSGTNQFHGGGFEFLRNDKLDARRPIDGSKPPFRLNQYGVNAGGPIARDRTFFFANYEGLQQRLAQTLIGNVPSAGYKAKVIAASPALRPVVDVFQPGTVSIDPNTDQLTTVGAQPWTENSGLFKVDHRFSDATSAYVRYNFDDGTIKAFQDALLETQTSLFRTQNVAIQLQHTFSPSLLSETKVGMNRSALHRNTDGAFSEGISVPGFINLQVNRKEIEVGTSLSLIQNLTWIRGRHTMKFGGEIRAIDLALADTGSTNTAFSNITDFINNKANTVTIASGLPSVGVRRPYYFAFGQDEARLASTLTASIGLRYEYYAVPHSKDGRGRVLDLERCGGFCAPGTPWYFADTTDFAPRVGFAWAPKRLNGRTVFRTGYGIFFGPGQVDDVNAAIDSIPETLSLSQRDQPSLSFPAADFASQARSQGIAPRALQRDRKEGYSQQWSFSIQQELPHSFVGQVSYVGNNGHRLFNRTFVNVIDPATGQRPYPSFSNVDQKQNHGNSSFNGLQLSLNRTAKAGLSWQTQYMWSHTINDNSGSGDGAQLMVSNCRPCDRGDADWDVRHTFTWSSVYSLPGPSHGFARRLFGGWTLSGMTTARTGIPFSPSVNRSASDLPDGVSTTPGKKAPAQRPNLVPGQPLYPSLPTPDSWLNLAAFSVPAKGTWGNAGRNILRGPGLWQVDTALEKRMRLRESLSMRFRAEFFNLFNRSQWGLPAANISQAAQYGRITSVVNSSPTGIGGPRQIQGMVRFEF